MPEMELELLKNKIKEILVLLVNQYEDMSLTINDIEDDMELSNNQIVPINSITAMRLLIEIENEFDIEVPDESLDMQNFRNINVMSSFISGLIVSAEHNKKDEKIR